MLQAIAATMGTFHRRGHRAGCRGDNALSCRDPFFLRRAIFIYDSNSCHWLPRKTAGSRVG